MSSTATTIVIAGCLLVLAILVVGFASFAKGGEFYTRFGNRIMQLRVVAQFCVVIMIVVIAWLTRG